MKYSRKSIAFIITSSFSLSLLAGDIEPPSAPGDSGSRVGSQTQFQAQIHSQGGRHANSAQLSRTDAQTVQIEMKLIIDPEHVGKPAELLIVALYQNPNSQTIAYILHSAPIIKKKYILCYY